LKIYKNCSGKLSHCSKLQKNGVKKELDGAGVNIDHRPVENPKRKV
jgi:hypothetical protein